MGTPAVGVFLSVLRKRKGLEMKSAKKVTPIIQIFTETVKSIREIPIRLYILPFLLTDSFFF